MTIFNVEKMKRFVNRDMLLKRMYADLMKRGTITEENVLEVLFNSEVLEDSIMEEEYNKINQ